MTKIVATHYPISLSTLPSSWASARVGEVTFDIQPGFASGVHNQEGRGIPHLRPMNVDREGRLDLNVVKYVSASSPLRVQFGDVLFNNTNSAELIGKTAHIGIEADLAFSNHMTRLRPVKGIDPRFMAHQLHFLWMTGYFQHRCTHHVNQASVSSTTLAESVPFAVAPSREQLRIAQEIEKQFTRLEAAVTALGRVQANLKRYRAAVLKAACEGHLVPTEAELALHERRSYEHGSALLNRILGERRSHRGAAPKTNRQAIGREPSDGIVKPQYQEPGFPDTKELAPLPEGWVWARAEQICDFITKGTTPAAEKLFADAGEVPYIKVYNLTNRGTLDFGVNPTFIARTTHDGELVRSRVFPNDVLMNIVGPPLGKVSIVPSEYPEWNINQAIAIFRPMPSFAVKYLSYCLLSETVLNWAIRRSKATAGQFNLTLQICRDLPVPVPPADEQRRIVSELERRLSVIEEMELQTSKDLTRAKYLRQAILKRAFEGNLVPQDTTDEPANVLLERIRAEKETVVKAAVQRGRSK